MQEICTEAALGPGAVYRYFPGKDAIIEAMAEHERREARGILAGVNAKASPAEQLRAIGKALGERYRSLGDTGLMAEIYAEGLRNKRVGEIVREAEQLWLDGLTGLLQRGQQAGQLDGTLDARHTALLLTAMWDGMLLRHACHPEARTPALATFCDAMLDRLLGKNGMPAKKPAAKPKKPVKARKAPARAPVTASLFDDAPVVEIDVRQMSLI